MKFTFLLIITFIMGTQACCPASLQDSKDCHHCGKCKTRVLQDKEKDYWCKERVCGTATYHLKTCKVEWKGLCGLLKCDKGVRNFFFIMPPKNDLVIFFGNILIYRD